MPVGGRGMGIGAIIIALIATFVFGIDPRIVLGLLGGAGGGPTTQIQAPAEPAGRPSDEIGLFASKVLADTEDTWREIFRQSGGTYREPKLVLFSGVFPTACGVGQSAAGPFYCPNDQKVYVDLNFFRELKERFRAPGDFAQAYVIAHEVGHHIQNQLGIMEKTAQLRQRMSEREYNEVSVRVELQADCFAGVWAHHANKRNVLEPGDIDEALRAASAIGDDVLQRRSQGYVVPDSFTHGSAAQRTRWFRIGFDSGAMQACNTFDARSV
jgi:predicted metalloprotease